VHSPAAREDLRYNPVRNSDCAGIKEDLRHRQAGLLPEALSVLGGHLKAGQLWTLQNRPVEVKSPGLVFFAPLPPVVASSPGVWFANCGART